VSAAGTPLRIATRKSPLALWQAEHVAALLRAAHPGIDVELVPTVTQGDRIQDRSLAVIGGKGLFIKELEVAMEEGRADIAVHSMKDVPAEMPPGFCIGAVLKRADPFDAFVAKPGIAAFSDLPRGARVGSSSLRRQAQLLALRPDLIVQTLRGNVDTRLKKLDQGEFDAILLACAGLMRLGLEARITARLDPQKCLPAVSQGIIGIECRGEAESTRHLLAALEDASTRIVMDAERAFSQGLGGSCTSPIAAYAQLEGNQLTLEGLVAEPDGSRLLRNTEKGAGSQARAVGTQLAERLLAAGAGTLLERLRSS
jgi:hydroxymethylbilane synthase